MNELLRELGWSPRWQAALEQLHQSAWYPARICRETRINFSLLAPGIGEHEAVLAGKLWHDAATDADLPTVGDWVAVDPGDGSELPVVRALLPRQNRFSRKVPGKSCAEQVIAANVDVVVVVTDALVDFNPKRIERYLTLIRKSEAQPMVLVNKKDVTPTEVIRTALAQLESMAPGAVHSVSALQTEGLPPQLLAPPPGCTMLIVGSSGVGKSTLVNALLQHECRQTGAVNAVTGKGRHTTVARELLLLPGGGVLIDNPGMREVQMWTDAATLRAQFADVELLARQCRFADCSHRADAGCAVRAALLSGSLSQERYEHFLLLDVEIAALEQRAEKRRMTLERVSRRQKHGVLRNPSDREELSHFLAPHRRKWQTGEG